jgi:hypothetical protein
VDPKGVDPRPLECHAILARLAPMSLPGFQANEWSKRHSHVVEACLALDVRDVPPYLDAGDAGTMQATTSLNWRQATSSPCGGSNGGRN